ncbi:phosphoribosylanthranilate isomerase [Kibdelosporangium philippinense]|uniref:N-(5'-phosphoribosyl)anthranilate isomerase n=1 Tax=Kibdelosporangium philippinense TaxID=211113 RepID=A0ABS8ZSS7_9PSEU|nr:phosphoribosylanthranilate isomerase [Kibdelosporangium philippinense]MCE7010303.1 phosphoribosylanthranilate isomerase [Kibdelosporangium philippinense]
MYVKVCGLRTEGDVAAAVGAGADAVGFVFAASPRKIDIPTARKLIADVPPNVLTVGVFLKQPAEEVREIALATGVGILQLHGDYPHETFAELAEFRLMRATSLTPETDITVGAFGEELLLLDSPQAGSGERWDLTPIASSRPEGQWLLAGGLNPGNVRAAIDAVRPWGVDVSSGVESSRGVKDHDLIRAFVAEAKRITADKSS